MAAESRDDVRLSDEDARRILVRAAELDGVQASEVTVTQLRQIVLESGIAAEAFDAALRETRALVATGPVPPPASNVSAASPDVAGVTPEARPISVPLWVRLCMFGVPDRRAATVYYWLFGGAMVAWPFRALIDAPGIGEPTTFGTALGMGFCGFALWTTSCAIRWLDRHGWRSLP